MQDFLLETLQEIYIRDLIVKERYYRDTNQWLRLRECYHADASKTLVAVTWINDTIDRFISAAKQLSDWGNNPLHYITPGVISVRRNRATVQSMCKIFLRITELGREYDLTSHVRFLHKVERRQTDGMWRILSLETIYERDSITPSTPNSNCVMSIDTKDRRESYKHLCWLLERTGFEIGCDLPGSDLPQTVEDLLKRANIWLNEDPVT